MPPKKIAGDDELICYVKRKLVTIGMQEGMDPRVTRPLI